MLGLPIVLLLVERSFSLRTLEYTIQNQLNAGYGFVKKKKKLQGWQVLISIIE